MKNYTIEQLKKIRDIYAISCVDDKLRELYISEQRMFNKQTFMFFNWIEKEANLVAEIIKPWITQQRIVDILSVDDNLKNRISIRDNYYVSVKFDAFSVEVRIMENYVDIWVQEETAYVVTSVPIPSTLSSFFSKHLRFTVNCVINHRAI